MRIAWAIGALLLSGCVVPVQERSDEQCPLATGPANAAPAGSWGLPPPDLAQKFVGLIGDSLLGQPEQEMSGTQSVTTWTTSQGTLTILAGTYNGFGLETAFNATQVSELHYETYSPADGNGNYGSQSAGPDGLSTAQQLAGPTVEIGSSDSSLEQDTPVGKFVVGRTGYGQLQLSPAYQLPATVIGRAAAQEAVRSYAECKWSSHRGIQEGHPRILSGRLVYGWVVDVGKCHTDWVDVDAQGLGILSHHLYGSCM